MREIIGSFDSTSYSFFALAAAACIVCALYYRHRRERLSHAHEPQGCSMPPAAARDGLTTRICESIAEGIMVTDAKQVIQYINPAFTEITGYGEADMIGKTPRVLSSGKHTREFYDGMWRGIRSDGRWSGEIWNKRKDGEIYLEQITVTAVKDKQGEVVYYVGVFKDITQQKQLEEQIRYQARHDAVTGLPNRLLLNQRMEDALKEADRNGQLAAVLFIDLDRFKRINDTLGHAAGDRLLHVVADRLAACLRPQDTMARIGGDEFVVLLPGLTDRAESEAIARRLVAAMSAPFDKDGHQLYVSASIGISCYPEDGMTPDVLVARADYAMYRAKEQGRNNFQTYKSGQDESPAALLPIETALRHAIQNNELQIYYQPQVLAADGSITGAEALLRWFHPEMGAIPPSQFISIAEESGFITVLDQWVLKQVCRHAAEWLSAGKDDFRVSVNLSMAQFNRQDLFDQIAASLDEAGLPARYLEIELTESTLMSDPDIALTTIERLKRMGVSIALDDFGIGYSSLNYLKQLPINRIKIDQSFVRSIQDDPRNQAIVQTIIQLCRNMNLDVIAEGVESQAEREYLMHAGCAEIQGFLFSAAVPRPELQDWFVNGRKLGISPQQHLPI